MTSLSGHVSSQIILRPFPPLFNAARNRPITSSPSVSTCGIPSRNAYCKSSVFAVSVEQCTQDFCVQTCPYRTALPTPVNLLIVTSPDQGQCIAVDTVNTKPGSVTGEKSTFFVMEGVHCYLTPVETPVVGPEGSITIAVWVWQQEDNSGTLLQKVSSSTQEIILELQISKIGVAFTFRSNAGVSTVTLLESLPQRTWIHLAIQVYLTTLSFYLNGPGPGYTTARTLDLGSPILDGQGEARIGQTLSGTNQFLGRIQDFVFFDVTLTNREISQLYTGTLPETRAQSECLCPPSHPRIKPNQEHYCIPNGVPDNQGDTELRLNNQSHNLQYINDGDTRSIWISKFQDTANITVDLGDKFQVFYIELLFYSPMPKAVSIERQKNLTSSWEMWQMYAENCFDYFKQPDNGPLTSSTSVNCIKFGTRVEDVPYSKGNITMSLLASEPVARPGYTDFYNTPELQDFVEASRIHIQFIDHYYVNTLRHEYYGVYEFSVTARCVCNGHAFDCDTSVLPYKCNCTADSHTIGDKCDQCDPLYNSKPFRKGDQINAYNCKACQCYGHASSCVYDKDLDLFPADHDLGGGGLCVNCQHNTAGRFCDTCVTLYYRPVGKSKFDEDVCTMCLCDKTGILGFNTDCEKEGGQCRCKSNVGGRRCDECKPGFYNLNSSNPFGCASCGCDVQGTVAANQSCHAITGDCFCKPNVRNAKCDACQYGFYNLTYDNPLGCTSCQCNPQGSTSSFCNSQTGMCSCKDNIVGRQCDQCAPGFHDFAQGCLPCQCNVQGTVEDTYCDVVTGQCVCKINTQGQRCSECRDGSFGFGASSVKGCYDCTCNLAGTLNSSLTCDKTTGSCMCKNNVEGTNCNVCKGNTFGLTITNPEGCEPCNCDPSGTQGGSPGGVSSDLSCNQNTGQCTCLANRIGRRCDDCDKGYYYNPDPGVGCNSCGCNIAATIPQTFCDSQTGQCQCKGDNSGVIGRTCSECMEEFYQFNSLTGTCSNCDCSPAGTVNKTQTCDPVSGNCMCKIFVTERRCDTCTADASFLDRANPYGCSKEPTQQPPPSHDQINSTTLKLMWQQPDYPNGIIIQYKLYRNGTLVFTGGANATEYMDVKLAAYVRYTYVVEATNDFGSVLSSPVTFRTLPGSPTGMVIVYITNVHSRSASFSWNQPVNMNGPLVNYSVTASSPSRPTRAVHWTGLSRQANVTDFVPFTNYTIIVETCTPGGCLDSWPAMFLTKSDMPSGMMDPIITTLSETELLISWQPPTEANGVIIFYELWIRGYSINGTRNPLETRIFHPSGQFNPRPTLSPQENVLPPPDTSFKVTGLNPFSLYEFQVLAENSVGKAASAWVMARTGEAPPLFTPAPTVTPVSSTELQVKWTAPTMEESRGTIRSYLLYYLKKSNLTAHPFAPPFIWTLLSNTSGDTMTHVVDQLKAYTNYTFMVGACNSMGCINSTEGYGFTLQDAPRVMGKPAVASLNSTVIQVAWAPPLYPNGPEPQYSVQKTTPALSFPPQVVAGTRFPGGGYYKFPAETIPSNVGFTGIQLWFRTRQRDGLLLYAASAGKQEEFLALQFRAGRPWFLFDPQGCVSYVEIDPQSDSDRTYDDNTWHFLEAVRDDEYAVITIDNEFKGRRENRCASGTIIGPSSGLYVGGLPTDYVIRRQDDDTRVQIIRQGFQGCIRDIMILHQVYPVEVWKPLDWNTAETNDLAYFNWQGCPINLDRGYHFQGQGFMTLPNDYWTLGDRQELRFSFRSDMHTGLLFFTHGGPGVYAFVALIDGSVYFEFSNNVATGGVTLKPTDNDFCDGRWYDTLIYKNNQEATISLSNGGGTATQGDPNFKLKVQPISDLFVGGIPVDSDAYNFIIRHKLSAPLEEFGGCLADLRIGEFSPYYLVYMNAISLVKIVENVNLDGCTPYHLPAVTCRDDVVEYIYNGTETTHLDADLHPYSDYLYRVVASNDAGWVSSSWGYGQTKEGAPIGVKPPFEVKVLSGYVITARWQSPLITAGLLTKYILLAYDRKSPKVPPVQEEFTIDKMYGEITTAIPSTNYSVRVVACTGGGCSESSTGVNVTTKEEAPEEVPTPTAVAATTFLTVYWDIPGRPNGVITGYFLYQDGRQIYSGGQRLFNITGLQVYTSYQFYVRACTQVGCTDGPATLLSTAQLPPQFVKPPVLVALGTTRVDVRWEKPEQMNGVLQRYLLYLSTEANFIGEVVYNTSDFFTNYIVPDLTAGTTYFITLSACTMGGCTLSTVSEVLTEESAPEGVPDPVITSPSPTEIIVTWDVPSLPNGHIVRYELYHNEVLVYQGMTMTYQVTGLLPYSLHTFRVRACTIQGCGSSLMVDGRTLEAAPQGFIVMTMEVEGPRTVKVSWNPPSEQNGIVYYSVNFDGSFYADPENWDYAVIQDARSLFYGTNHSQSISITGLIPMSSYDIQVNASNTGGYILSNIRRADLPQGSPDGVKPPNLLSESPSSITAMWEPVGRENAQESPQFVLQFRNLNNDTMVEDIFGPTTSFIHTTRDLVPYTVYEFRMKAFNSYGYTLSNWISYRTLQDKPGSFDPPLIAAVGARYIDLTWQHPLEANGVIKEYKVYQNNVFRILVLGNDTSYRAIDLDPFILYNFALEACTEGGCSRTNDSSTVRTLEDVPAGFEPPTAISLTPTSVEIKWTAPLYPNGLVSAYELERLANGSENIYSIRTVLPTSTMVYIDDAAELSPFTTYFYRVKAVNGAGSTASDWATIVTMSSRPTGMLPPNVQILGPRAMRITWQAPLKPNGLLEMYVVRLPEPRQEIRNTSVMSLNMTDLLPFSTFSVTVTACTDGGCTESPAVSVRTDPTIPEGQAPPIPHPVSQNMIAIAWQGPGLANGPNIRFELSRMKILQPLLTNPVGLNVWSSVFIGTVTYYEDRGLPLFTTFKYRVTVYNDVGQLTSDASREVTTYGGFPRKEANVTVVPLDHVTLQVDWVTPSVVDLQGSVTVFTLVAVGKMRTIKQDYTPDTHGILLQNLTPNTEYSITLTITIHGDAQITSLPVVAQTLDGAPEGLAKPSLTVVNDTALRVAWTNPVKANGEITGFNIIINNNKIPTGMVTAGSKVITQLLPYTIYTVKVEVCTVFDCTTSESLLVTTAEALPQQFTPPSVTALSSISVQVDWTSPERSNGIILRYDLFRSTIKQCSEIPPATVSPEITKCTYIMCDILENLCGGVCYSGPKVCCDGVLHDSQLGFDCCGRDYTAKQSPDDICCGGQFHRKINDYKCCKDRYVRVQTGEVCCEDKYEDRITVGIGDKCCGSVPYSYMGAQVCCGDKLYDGYNQQCCGGEVISNHMACCGDAQEGSAFTARPGMECCGMSYVIMNRTLCCTSDTGHSKVHMYKDEDAKLSANEKCCGMETISNNLDCCNFVGYNPLTYVCADSSNQEPGCGQGTICPLSVQDFAFCDICNFDKGSEICGSVRGHHGNNPSPNPTPDPTADCIATEERIYSGMEMTYTDDVLTPYSTYGYAFAAVNSAGGSTSSYTKVMTLQAPPDKVNPPKVNIDPSQLYVIDLIWKLPQKPNGVITRYILTRDGIELYRGLAQQYTDDTTVLPYRSYTYILTACNTAGCTASDKVTVATAEGKPEDVLPPSVNVLSSASLEVSWSPPVKPNGIISHYTVTFEMENGFTWSNTTMGVSLTITGLTPYTQYSVTLEVCTKGGCTVSPTVLSRTLEDLPKGVIPPRVVVLSSKSTLVFWNPPRNAYGIIKFYSILRRWATGAMYIYFGPGLFTTDNFLMPGETYDYFLITGNNAGNTSSHPRTLTMPPTALVNVPAAREVTVLSATSVYIAWDAIVSGQIPIDQYRVLLNAGQDSEVDKGVGLDLSTTVTGLKPNFEYSVRVTACLEGVSNGCATGPGVIAHTLEAPPENLAPPRVKATAPNVVDVSWTSPQQPNGVITQYLIYYREAGSTVDLLINRVMGDVMSIRHAGQDLEPYTTYEYKVVAGNSQGDVSSTWTMVRTLESTPAGLTKPFINSTGAFSFHISWQPPAYPNGVITMYTIHYRILTNDPTQEAPLQMVQVSENTLTTSVSGLEPFSNYHVHITAYNNVGNTSSDKVLVQTAQSSPSGLAAFVVEKISTGTSVILKWDVPGKPNGVISIYNIYEVGSAIALYKGLNREFEFRRLQPYTDYHVQMEACTVAGCTRGPVYTFVTAETPPADQSSPTIGNVTSSRVVITWTKPVRPNGMISMYEVLRRSQTRVVRRSLSAPEVVYTTTNVDQDSYQYVDMDLDAFSEFQYSIRSSNSKGFIQSPWTSVFTSQAAPEWLAPPTVSFISGHQDSLNIKWVPSSQPNGILQSYQLQRNNSVPLSFTIHDPMEFNDTGLLAYTWYSYKVTACTAGGCTTSDPTHFRTKETAPLLVSPPSINTWNSTTLRLEWQSPLTTNGKISLFNLKMDNAVIYSGIATVYIQTGLTPYTEYSFVLTACTTGGCTDSGEVKGRPDDDIPLGLNAPILNVISSKSIEVTWGPPQYPNGIISSYDLRRDGELIYTESISVTGSLRTSYVDYNLEPGTEYSYIIIARNRKGSVDSLASIATTYSASPSGLDPPVLRALSSTSVQVTWQPPVQPNGPIRNYTVFENNNVVFSAGPEILSYIVPGLEFWTEYSFRVKACTERGCELSGMTTVSTLEAPPEEQKPPKLLALADQDGAHAGVLITWEPPLKPNGIVVSYEVYRRQVISELTGTSYGKIALVYNSSLLRYSDLADTLSAFTDYQYMVTAVNRAGKVSSVWAVATTKEGPPQGLGPPIINSTTATSITMTIIPPTQPNGVIRHYTVLVNGTLGSSGQRLTQTVGENMALMPFTVYALQSQACTGGGCATSGTAIAKTGAAKPTGLEPIRVVDTNSSTIRLGWSYPTSPNGAIVRFLIYQRRACPPTNQPFPQTCVVGDPSIAFDGLAIERAIVSLLPYTAYEFQIQAENEAGYVDFPTWVWAETRPAAPQYVKFPLLYMNGTTAVFDWLLSFNLQGELREFILLVDGRVVFRGVSFLHQLPNIEQDKTMEFAIAAITETGQVESPAIIFDPNAIDNIGTTPKPTSGPVLLVQKMFYQEVWFIVLLVLITVLLIFIIIALCLRHIHGRRPYIRERTPLRPRHRKGSQPFTFSSSDDSIFETEMSGRPYHTSKPGHMFSSRGEGVTNPAFSNRRMMHLDSSPESSSSRSKYEDDFDDVLDDDDIDYLWKKGRESTLFGEEDDDSGELPAYSITKEQTVFTDTHL
ncbi:usherin-like [Mizuhopecten yessoensis]|uniref:usherin-like n=1 Tax=Mizuhopecten yessoensis TaxID=6573 RepID=UPI000B457C20|nr:usherin-like [Mizuhopecten yessoensis]